MSSTPTKPPPSTHLVYSIAGCSEPSGRYVAENILVDYPTEQASRWSGAYSVPNMNQWILLRLDTLAVLKSITFGKFHKPHPCNMKEFKLYVGITEDHMIEVLHSGLKNDSISETFSVNHINSAGVYFPTRFVKIIPLSAHGQSFHTSIWYVSMTGITDECYVERVRTNHDEYRETITLRHILKYLRQRRLLTSYQSVLSRANLQPEHPLVTELHERIVLQGNWGKAEEIIIRASQVGLFDAYLRSSQPHAIWKSLHGVDPDGDAPSKRGGHAMCIDHENALIYLLGGWDGQKSLGDFWVYDVKTDNWMLLSHCTSREKNGPGPRSCHKMVYDTKTGSIYLLGRLTDSDGQRTRGGATSTTDTTQPQSSLDLNLPPRRSSGDGGPATAFCSEFYRYHTRGLDAGKWDLLSFDTASSGGPPLVFDHQMVMDCDAQILYVFGGRVVDGDWDSVKYSGLYSYNVRLSKWRMLQPSDASSPSHVYIPSRFGHSMVFEPTARTLYIFAGQRDDKYLSDMYAYDIATNTATEVYSNFTSAGGPNACFTQRAVIDPKLKELYIFCGLTRNQQVGSMTILQSVWPNWIYRYDTRPGKWTRILPEADDGCDDERRVVEEPSPRYAHQVVYNPTTQTIFMHGGNAGIAGGAMEQRNVADGNTDRDEQREDGEGHKERRLDDFWCMTLKRPAPEEIIRRATYQIRQQQFREMCEQSTPVKALNFLQTEVSSVVDHNNPQETEIFRSLLSHLLAPQTLPDPGPSQSPALSYKAPPSSARLTTPSRKRTRPNTPDESWTSRLDEDEVMGDSAVSVSPPKVISSEPRSCSVRLISSQVLRGVEDTEERNLRNSGERPLSALRFEQRTEVFELLLEFLGEDCKQPSANLLDMIDRQETTP